MIGEERVIVSNIAGTTRDAIDTRFTYNQRDFVIVDTAGMRKRGKCMRQLKNTASSEL